MQMNSVDHNLIIANYGASQGFDTDDGSRYKRREAKRNLPLYSRVLCAACVCVCVCAVFGAMCAVCCVRGAAY